MQRRIYFVHNWVHNVESFLGYTDLRLQKGVELIWDDHNPEILFASDNIYTSKRCNDIFRSLYDKAPITVYFGTEASFMDFNLFDYGVGFDNSLKSERYTQLPIERIFRNMFKEEPIGKEEVVNLLSGGGKFCNFMYSNANAHPFRDRLFYALSEYKHVDSLGAHLNNTGRGGTGFVGHYQEMVDLKRGYKFSVASENAKFPGYTSEKIYTSLNAHTVPIYWGNPDIELEINPACFVNCMKLGSMENIIQEIKRIDNDDESWKEMISSPWHTPAQVEYISQRSNEYDRFLNRILCEPINDLKERCIGTYQWHYRSWFLQTKIDMSIMTRLKRKLFSDSSNKVKEL